MKKLKLFSLLVLVTGCVTMIGCSKGNTGPAGPVGPDSVQYSNRAPLSMIRRIDARADTSYSQTIVARAITSAILNKGAVVGYLQGVGTAGDTIIVNAATVMGEYFAVGRIELYSGAPYASNSAGVDYSRYNYRYVIVPAKIATSKASGSLQSYTPAQLKTLSYAEATKLLNIPSQGSSQQVSPVQ